MPFHLLARFFFTRISKGSIWILFILVFAGSCRDVTPASKEAHPTESLSEATEKTTTPPSIRYTLPHDVPIRTYFEFMDSLVAHFDTLLNYPLTEHLIVRYNPWLIDTLAHTDYYYLMALGIFQEDPQGLLALRQGETLLIPDSLQSDSLRQLMAQTSLDINIPAFQLRILEGEHTRYTFPVRVGQNQKKYLAMAGRVVDLRTQTGVGYIWRINKNPVFINPKDNHRYEVTRRDDGKITKLPRIPWLDPELNGHRFGQLIHPTTNPETLGKAYSNGCIGMREGDMWRVYYYAPIGTRTVFRYDLETINDQGDTIRYKNIYPGYERPRNRTAILAAAVGVLSADQDPSMATLCDCR
jgi:hypothetical protein